MEIRGGVAVGFAIASLASGAAQAEPTQRVKLRYAAPQECPDDLELVEAVERFLGQSLRDTREQALTIDARVQGDPRQGYSAKLTFDGSEGSQVRFIDHTDCSKLVEAAALMTAIAIDPKRVELRQRGELVAPPQAAANTESAVPSPPQALTTPGVLAEPRADKPPKPSSPGSNTKGGSLRPRVALLALATGGILPSVAPGLGAELSFRYRWLELGVDGRYWAARNQTVAAAPASSIDISLAAAGVRLCGVPTSGSWSLLLCAGGQLGDMQGVGQGVDNARTRHDGFAALNGGVAVAYSRERLMPIAGVDLYGALARPQFGVQLNGRETLVFRTRPWGMGGFVGLVYRM